MWFGSRLKGSRAHENSTSCFGSESCAASLMRSTVRKTRLAYVENETLQVTNSGERVRGVEGADDQRAGILVVPAHHAGLALHYSKALRRRPDC